MNKPFFIAIAGPSASGKTTLARQLAEQLGMHEHQVIAEDAYYHDHPQLSEADRAQLNFDHPDAFDHNLLAQHLEALQNGQPVHIPVYDYARHRRSQESRRLKPDAVVIVEGLLLLHRPRLREYFHHSVFLDVDLELCFRRRMARDIHERGRTPEQVQQQFQQTVQPMYEQFVEPSMQFADQVASGNDHDRLINDLLAVVNDPAKSR